MSASPVPNSFEWERQRIAFDEALEPSGAEILDEVRQFIGRFCAFPQAHALNAVALWAAHTHMVLNFHTTPRLLLSSPEAGSGKTRVLEVLDLLVPEPMFSLSTSPAAIFRTLKERQITLLFDEVDTIWSKSGKDDNHEDLRALLNAGYKRGAKIPRCVGPRHEVHQFPVFAAVALAGLGELPDTIMSRAVIIRMRPRGPADRVEPFRSRIHDSEGYAIRDSLSAWATKTGPTAGDSWPPLPEGIVDRPAELWEPLLAIADVAGGHWPTTAREACVALCAVAQDRSASLGIRLLTDLRIIFGTEEAMHTELILQKLHLGEPAGLDADSPWGDLRGKPLSTRQLAEMLRPYGVKSSKIRILGQALQGYRRANLQDAWQRYLPPMSAETEQPERAEPFQISQWPGTAPSSGSSGSSAPADTGESSEAWWDNP